MRSRFCAQRYNNGEYEYNGLHWRTVKRTDLGAVEPPQPQERVMYYSAEWQLLQEDIDEAHTNYPGVDRMAQQLWGIRSIDDAIMRRQHWIYLDIPDPLHYHLTDVQFSTVAMTGIGLKPMLYERVVYSPYGQARHHFGGDVNWDGKIDSTDTDYPVRTAPGATIGQSSYRADADTTRDGVLNTSDLSAMMSFLGLPALSDGQISASGTQFPDNIIGFGGYVHNRESKLYTVRNRWYVPVLGRWLERDPSGYVDGMSMYLYASASPWMMRDPMGLDPFDTVVSDQATYNARVLALVGEGKLDPMTASRMLNDHLGATQGRIRATHAQIDLAKRTVGVRAVANATSETVTSFATLGTYDGSVFSVSDIDRAAGYNTSYAVARVSTELGFGVATGGLAAAGRAGQLGTHGGRAAQGVFGLDMLGNASMAGQGASSMMLDGVTWENAIQVGGGVAGIGGNFGGLSRSVQCPSPNGVTNGTFSKITPATEKQLQKKFKHAVDFGITGNYNPANAKKYNQVIQGHLNAPGTKEILGAYRGNPAKFHTDPTTGLTVIQNPNGGFLSGWKLNPQQLQRVTKDGNL